VKTEHHRDIADWQDSYIGVLESLYGSMFVQSDLGIEEVNLEWIRLLMSEEYTPARYQQVA
jgi:hypothetical protein